MFFDYSSNLLYGSNNQCIVEIFLYGKRTNIYVGYMLLEMYNFIYMGYFQKAFGIISSVPHIKMAKIN